ncbi:hypothetical protein NHX12_002393 [Muraenolepis orangiensis]|uniref:Uncharacterized protein n=1 Tax=Muraenolepis orangiensis TaxID=630683 RepID=A0A9Q0DUD4_9TELE|nr:hypothetical protein NHX12_002393 [Muraenolepis orangiensis]
MNCMESLPPPPPPHGSRCVRSPGLEPPNGLHIPGGSGLPGQVQRGSRGPKGSRVSPRFPVLYAGTESPAGCTHKDRFAQPQGVRGNQRLPHVSRLPTTPPPPPPHPQVHSLFVTESCQELPPCMITQPCSQPWSSPGSALVQPCSQPVSQPWSSPVPSPIPSPGPALVLPSFNPVPSPSPALVQPWFNPVPSLVLSLRSALFPALV